MDAQSESRTARARLAKSAAFADRSETTPADDGISFVGLTTTTGSYPTDPSAVYMVIPQEIDCGDDEGDSASFSNDSPGGTPVPAINVGTAVPPQGTLVLCHCAGGRTCFRYDG